MTLDPSETSGGREGRQQELRILQPNINTRGRGGLGRPKTRGTGRVETENEDKDPTIRRLHNQEIHYKSDIFFRYTNCTQIRRLPFSDQDYFSTQGDGYHPADVYRNSDLTTSLLIQERSQSRNPIPQAIRILRLHQQFRCADKPAGKFKLRVRG
jgi:hypothetical protein